MKSTDLRISQLGLECSFQLKAVIVTVVQTYSHKEPLGLGKYTCEHLFLYSELKLEYTFHLMKEKEEEEGYSEYKYAN